MMKLNYLGLIGMLACGAYAVEGQDDAGCTINIKNSNKKSYVTQHVIEAPGLHDSHHLRSVQTKQDITDTSMCSHLSSDDELVKKDAYFVTDTHDHDGNGSGHEVFTTKQGHQIFLKTVSASHRIPDSDKADEIVVGEVVGGTGPYQGVTGHYQSKNSFDWKKKQIESVQQVLELQKD